MPNTIVAKVVALKPHTAFGESHDTGDTYDLAEEFVATVMAQGMVRREDATDAAPAPKPPRAKRPTPKPAKTERRTPTPRTAKPVRTAKIRGKAATKRKR